LHLQFPLLQQLRIFLRTRLFLRSPLPPIIKKPVLPPVTEELVDGH
jgi:hypothetical protein